MPAGGAYGVREGDGYLTWPSPNGRDFAKGRIKRGGPSVVGEGEIGSKHRVTNREGTRGRDQGPVRLNREGAVRRAAAPDPARLVTGVDRFYRRLGSLET